MLCPEEYRKEALRREIRKDIPLTAVVLSALIFLCVLALVMPEYIRSVFLVAAALFAIPLFIILDITVMTIWRKKKWAVSIGSIDEVFLVDEESCPATVAKIRYLSSDGRECIHEHQIQGWGDYEEGCEDKVKQMLAEDKKKYENKILPVFYNPENPVRCLVMTEDISEPQ